jgi:hypothetical protein
VQVIEGLANKKVTPGYAYIGEGRLQEPVLNGDRLRSEFSDAEVRHEHCAVYDKEAIQKIPVYHCSPRRIQQGDKDDVNEGKQTSQKPRVVKGKLPGV